MNVNWIDIVSSFWVLFALLQMIMDNPLNAICGALIALVYAVYGWRDNHE